jgi:SAM-dependent methyltransferase
MTNFQVLVVAPVDRNRDMFAGWRFYDLAFRFVDDYPTDGFSAWRTESSASGETIDVAAHCHAYSGGYAQHALNRFFSQALLRYQPRVVVVVGLTGCTVDLLRVADLLGIPAVLILDGPVEPPNALSEATLEWLRSSLASCRAVLALQGKPDSSWPDAWLDRTTVAELGVLDTLLDKLVEQSLPAYGFDYSMYEFCQRDQPLLVNMQRNDVRHFQASTAVLDLACGVGIFLDCLRQAGINAEGVERDPRIARYARGMGLNVSTDDALAYLENTTKRFDGIYCSHFVEHLPLEGVQQMLQLIAQRVASGGILVLVFPDPESIRSQLLGFWRDPEHVRFYHPELITSMAATHGLELEWSSYMEQPHRVVSFTETPKPEDQGAPFPALPVIVEKNRRGLGERMLQKFGLVSERQFRRLEDRLMEWSRTLEYQSRQYVDASKQLEERTRSLWDVNQTWAWNDNVTLRFRKGREQ